MINDKADSHFAPVMSNRDPGIEEKKTVYCMPVIFNETINDDTCYMYMM